MRAGAVFIPRAAGKVRKSHARSKARRSREYPSPQWSNSFSDRQVNTVSNRYIPQSDGSFQKNHVPDQRNQPPRPNPPCPPQPDCPPQTPPSRTDTSAGSFLKQLLPKKFDTGDLLIVLLLLLMAGDCEEEKSNALLTLALYFFL